MNWVIGAYSNVYSTAMMKNSRIESHFATAKATAVKPAGRIARLFGKA